MKSEFEAPTYPGVGVPEPPLQPGPMSIEKAAEILRAHVDDVMRLINEHQLRVYPKAEGWPPSVLAVHGGDVYRLFLARQKRDAS